MSKFSFSLVIKSLLDEQTLCNDPLCVVDLNGVGEREGCVREAAMVYILHPSTM